MIGDNLDRQDGKLRAVSHRNHAPGYRRTRQNGYNIDNGYRGTGSLGAIGTHTGGGNAGYDRHT